MKKARALVGVLLLTITAIGASAPQGSQSANLTVSAHVVRNCLITVAPIDFGNYDPLVANKTQPLDKTSMMSILCTKGTAASIELDAGSNAQGSTRRMAAGGELLAYEVYTDSGHTDVWGTGSQAEQFSSAMMSASQQASTSTGNAGRVGKWMYGRIAAGQNVGPGDYSDTATVTINF